MAQNHTTKKGSDFLNSLMDILLGSPEGTVREPFIDPAEAVEKNKSIIKDIIEKTPAQKNKNNSSE